jgi:SAM-dependent methyltransferase
MDIVNREQAEYWNTGAHADHWLTNQAGYDRMLEPFTSMILDAAAITVAHRVLDVGCGSGATTCAAAGIAEAGEVVGVDLSGQMLARARDLAREAGLANASFIEGDAQVHPFEPRSFDIVISRFGVMFFADPAGAFANLRAATRPHGRLTFVCWQPLTQNQWLLVPGAALAEHVELPDLAPADQPGMFALADPGRLTRILEGAGWRDIHLASRRATVLVGGGGTLHDAVEFLRTGSLGRAVLADADPVTEDRAVTSVTAALAPFADAAGVHLDAAVWLVSAVA